MKRTTKKNTKWMPGESDLICSQHFVDGSQHFVENTSYRILIPRISEGCQETKESFEMLPINILPIADIVSNCASLWNLQPPLINQKTL